MNAQTKIEPEGLDKLRMPFPPHQISKLPKPTKAQTEAVKNDFKKGIRCQLCGAWHHPDVVHLDYVGHAALTDRLLDTDPEWSWEPIAYRDGLPAFDASGGLWIKLTVCGVTRLGYGHAAAKPGIDPGAREKEVIGDALRNAAMRFGAALDLWHKGDLHADDEDRPATINPGQELMLEDKMREAGVDKARFLGLAGVSATKDLPADKFEPAMQRLKGIIDKAQKAAAAKPAPSPQHDPVLEDEIPY